MSRRDLPHTTSLIFERHYGRRAFPRWSVAVSDRGGLSMRTFNTKAGCRRFARRLGRNAAWIR